MEKAFHQIMIYDKKLSANKPWFSIICLIHYRIKSVTISSFYKVYKVYKVYAEINSGIHDRLSEIDLEKMKKISRVFSFFLLFYKKMFQGPKGYIAPMCEKHLQYGISTTEWRFYTFLTEFHSVLFN